MAKRARVPGKGTCPEPPLGLCVAEKPLNLNASLWLSLDFATTSHIDEAIVAFELLNVWGPLLAFPFQLETKDHPLSAVHDA